MTVPASLAAGQVYVMGERKTGPAASVQFLLIPLLLTLFDILSDTVSAATDSQLTLCVYWMWGREGGLNPLSPKSDHHQISPSNVNAYSTHEVMRIKDMIIQHELFSYFNKFSLVLL